MAGSKSSTLNLRIDPDVKDALRAAAEGEHRSISNMVEVLIRDHCRVKGIPIPEQPAAGREAGDETGKGRPARRRART